MSIASAQAMVPASGRFDFNDDVTATFDDMLARNIPQYDLMRVTVTYLCGRFFQPLTDIVDLGSSRGETLARLPDPVVEHVRRLIATEMSKPMLTILRDRFPHAEVTALDLRRGYPMNVEASVTTAILTLMFVPLEHRLRLVRNVWQSTMPGGAFIIVEKILGAGPDLDTAYVDAHNTLKEGNGYSREDIDRNLLSLEGVLCPVTAEWNVSLLKSCGFSQVDCFWRWMNFAGWVAIKE